MYYYQVVVLMCSAHQVIVLMCGTNNHDHSAEQVRDDIYQEKTAT